LYGGIDSNAQLFHRKISSSLLAIYQKTLALAAIEIMINAKVTSSDARAGTEMHGLTTLKFLWVVY
jgi:hypothetical protein